MRGRPPSTRPATYYDFRRAIHITQMLERGFGLDEFHILAEHWNVEKHKDLQGQLQALAHHALEHGREESRG